MASGGAEDAWVDHYAALGLEVRAGAALPTRREISRAFRRLALALHPDKQPAGLGAADRAAVAARFEAVSLANEVLQSEELREAYDAKYAARMQEALRRRALDEQARAMELDLAQREREAREGDRDAHAARTAALETSQYIQAQDAAFKRKILAELDRERRATRATEAASPSAASPSAASRKAAASLAAASAQEVKFYTQLLRTQEDDILAALDAM